MRRYGPFLAPDGYVVSLQNGLNEPIIARAIGADGTLGPLADASRASVK